MDAKIALLRLRTGGVRLMLRDGSLKIKGNLTDEDKTLIKQHKDEIIVILTAEQETLASKGSKVDRLIETKGFAYIFSEVLGEKLIFADTDITAQQLSDSSDLVIYTMDELDVLCKDKSFTVKGLKRIHEAKKLFGGKITGDADLEAKRKSLKKDSKV